MKTFKKHLNEELKNRNFKTRYDEEMELMKISMKILEERNKLGLSQKELAHKARITQQQLSKVENGINCNMTTFLKVCHALNIKIGLRRAG